MKIKLDLSKQITDLKGKPVGEPTAGQILADTLLQGNSGPPLKILAISKDLDATGTVEVTADEYNMLVDQVEKSQRLTNLGKARILEQMEGSRIKAIPEPK